jgi:ribonuclease HIII
MEKKTIEQIMEIEPKIKKIFDMVIATRRMDEYNFHLYEQFKKQLSLCVGYYSKNIELANKDDYDTVIETLLIALYM